MVNTREGRKLILRWLCQRLGESDTGRRAQTTELEDVSPDFHPIKDTVYYRAANRASMQPDCPATGGDQITPHYVGLGCAG